MPPWPSTRSTRIDNQVRVKVHLQCGQLLPSPAADYRNLYEALTGESLRLCPKCKTGTLTVIQILPAHRFPDSS